jgi:copper(I)-binding protein
MKYLHATFLLAGLLLLSSVSFAAGKVQVRDAWIPEAPPSAGVMAAYLEIDNKGSKPVTITGFSCAAFGDVMMHKTVEKDGMSSMIHMETLTVAAKSKLKFERGGLHVMLMMPKHALKAGDKVAMTMHTADKHTIKFTAIVKPASLGEDDKK